MIENLGSKYTPISSKVHPKTNRNRICRFLSEFFTFHLRKQVNFIHYASFYQYSDIDSNKNVFRKI